MFDWIGLGAVNTGLLWGGAAVAAPILIHLLSRRRFRRVEWAAMDFLLEAERRNRRRIRLEHLLLLALRCLAVLLVALLAARLFLRPTGVLGGAFGSARRERIVVLDDSPSMEVKAAGRTVFEEARGGLVDFLRGLAREYPGDTVTLLTTSDPVRPVLSGQYLTGEKVESAVRTVEGLEVSDRAAEWDAALVALEEMLGAPRGNLNRVVTLVTDLRARDWLPAEEASAGGEKGEQGEGALAVLARLATKVDQTALVDVDVGAEGGPNLAVTDIAASERTVVAGVPVRFEVRVRNFSRAPAHGVEVRFMAGDALPVPVTVDRIEPGGRATVPFTLAFEDAAPVALRAEIEPDALPRDNVRFAVARVREGVPVLIVDGEPSAAYGEAESFYLRRALDPGGEARSGNVVEVVRENGFEDTLLDPYQVVILANLYRLSDARARALEAWVEKGGGLVVFLGDQVDAAAWNRLHEAGSPLVPVRLDAPVGDEAERRWVRFGADRLNHPVLEVFRGVQNPFLERVMFFRWWSTTVPKSDLESGATRTVATFSGEASSPALVERAAGDGRVLWCTSTADAEWTNWPADPSYVVALLEMVRHVARREPTSASVTVGTPLRAVLNPGRYEPRVEVEGPSGETFALEAAPADDGAALHLTYDETDTRGIYRVALARRNGTPERRLFAANIDPAEGDVMKAPPEEIRRRLGDAPVALLAGRAYLREGAAGAKSELWRSLLVALVVVLMAEQTLAWVFGRRR